LDIGQKERMKMKRHKLSAVIRTNKGRQVRREKQVPAVLYGRGMEAVQLAVPELEVNHFISHGSSNALIDLAVGKEQYTVMLKDLQLNRVKGTVLHVDFIVVDLGQKLTATVPVHLQGEAEGVKSGGVLQFQAREVEVKCLPTEIPHGFDLDISALNIGDSKTVADLMVAGDIEILTPETEVIVSVLAPRLADEQTETTETDDEMESPEQEPETE